MKPTSRKFTLVGLALAASMFLAGCGGGSAGAPGVTIAPYVTSIDATVTPAQTADGPITFTFNFNTDVGTSFTADDIEVTSSGGAAVVGALTRVSATQYTLVVTPPDKASGTIVVDVKGSFTDAAGTPSQGGILTVSRRFNTMPPSGNTGTCTSPCIDFTSAAVKYEPFGDMVSAGQVDDPADAANKVVRLVKGPGSQVWAGTTIFTVDADKSVPAFDLAASKVVTLRVYSPAAGIPIMLKIEDAADPGIFLEKTVNTTLANAWETLSYDFASPSNGTYNSANRYNKASVFPNFLVAETANAAYYFDELKYTAVAGGGPIVFASGFKSNNLTVENGEWGFYSGNFTDYANTYSGGGFTDQGVAPEDSFVYLVVTTSAPTTDGFMGIYTMAPGYTGASPNAGVTLSGQTSMKIELGWSAEWFNQGNNHQLLVRTIGAEEYANGSGGFCRILLESRVTPTTADLTTYTIPLSSMTLAQACNGGGFTSGVSTVAEALGKAIGEVHVQAVFPQANTTVLGGSEYPTGFTRGSIVFE